MIIPKFLYNIIRQPNLWGSIIPLHIITFISLFLIFNQLAPAWWWIATITGYIFINMLGISAGYHRLFCHKSFIVSRPIKLLLLWLGSISGQGSIIFWATVHRGYHHRYSDRDGDPHSPQQGFWHSYMGWMFTIKTGEFSSRSCMDLIRDADCVFIHRYYKTILWTSHLIIALISIDVWLYMFILPAFITLHGFAIQTSFTHTSSLGYTNYAREDHSRNVWWLFPLLGGDCWHNNHHGEPSNPNFGGRRNWEIDPTYWLIKLIKN